MGEGTAAMRYQMTADEAAARLGIPEEHHAVFVLLADRLRTPTASEAELAQLRDELAAVNEALRNAGIDYPTGARGVRDLSGLYEAAREGGA